jgi:hypothetical protein
MVDWAGQKLAEAVCLYLTSLFGAAGFLLGYWRQDFALMMKVGGMCGGRGGRAARAGARRSAARGAARRPGSIAIAVAAPGSWYATGGAARSREALRGGKPTDPPSLSPLLQVYAAGVALAGAATIPDWSWLNKNPLPWRPADTAPDSLLPPGTRRASNQRRLPVIE